MRPSTGWRIFVVVVSACLVASAYAEEEGTVDKTTAFSPDYATARDRFRDKVGQAQERLIAFELDEKGPPAETPSIDIAWFGAEEPSVLVELQDPAGGLVSGVVTSDKVYSVIRAARPLDGANEQYGARLPLRSSHKPA